MGFIYGIMLVLTIFAMAAILRVILGPTIWDRLLGLNLISSKIMMIMVLFALILEKSYLLDIALVYGFFGYIGIVLLARFVEKRGEL